MISRGKNVELFDSTFSNKFHMTPSESIFLAKKKWDENVYCGMKMENRAVTFPQTRTILNGVNVANVQLDDIQAILNMRDAWRYMIATINEPLTLEYQCKLNEFIARNESLQWGVLRTGSVMISGSNYEPPIPARGVVEQELADILAASCSATEKALDLFLWGTKGQFFWDGNKRTSLCLANKVLLSAGAGMMTITDAHMEHFNELLLDFYNLDQREPLKQFLYDNTIFGINFSGAGE